MAEREKKLTLKLSNGEYERLERIAGEHCMRKGDVLRHMITGTPLIEPPDENLRAIRRSLDRIESEAEMLAYLAAREGFCTEDTDRENDLEEYLTKLEGILDNLDEIREALAERK